MRKIVWCISMVLCCPSAAYGDDARKSKEPAEFTRPYPTLFDLMEAGTRKIPIERPSLFRDVPPLLLCADRDGVDAVLRNHLQSLRRCYESSVKRRLYSGTLALQWTVLTNGRVSSVRVIETDVDDTLSHCMASVIRRWRYPNTDAVCTVQRNFVFVQE